MSSVFDDDWETPDKLGLMGECVCVCVLTLVDAEPEDAALEKAPSGEFFLFFFPACVTSWTHGGS